MTISKEMIARINELAAKKKAEGLTEEETVEQKALYMEYLAGIRGQVRKKLESVRYIEDMTEEEIKKELAKRNN